MNLDISGGDGVGRVSTDTDDRVSGTFTIPSDAEHSVLTVYLLDGTSIVATISLQVTG